MEIALIIIGSLLAFYLLLLIVNIIFVVAFSHIMKKHNRAISIILSTTYDNVQSLLDLLKEKNVEKAIELEGQLTSLNVVAFDNQSHPESESMRKSLIDIKNVTISLCEDNDEVKNNEKYLTIKDSLEQLNTVFRSNVLMYNADVLGYNYWIRFLPWRYIWLLFRVKTKNTIS